MMLGRRKCYWYPPFRKAAVNVEPPEGVTFTHNQRSIVYWHEIDYVGERVSDNTPVPFLSKMLSLLSALVH